MHLYFKSWVDAKPKLESKPGLVELIQAHVNGRSPSWRDYLTEIRLPQASQPFLLLTAGVQDRSFVARVRAIDWPRLYQEHDLGNYLEKLREDWKQNLDFVLIDSRTGFTDVMAVSTVQLPDLIVLMFTANAQSLYGALDALES